MAAPDNMAGRQGRWRPSAGALVARGVMVESAGPAAVVLAVIRSQSRTQAVSRPRSGP